MKKVIVKITLSIMLIVTVTVAGFYWNEARKEIVFLCANFKKGVTEESVREQLDTGNFLKYLTEDIPGGKRIIAESPYNLYMNRCVIEFDSSGLVQSSTVN
ncbi:hypothetical protein G3570_09465 [Balneolaceae bacterium YR4-1]|uniref:Peptidase inhibitor I78 family protein n=1 Tax=Halalkalibaculum roseum TaxID=2709311 RepID=A0A6M1SV65_9BACT|nr:hypothetical protein [Halalkalibaculum roseum]NGP76860.1 hypothetical protein [Halalkalibaculum roseum]